MIITCNKCILSLYRTKIVNGNGNNPSDIMIVGEAPGKDEDIQGKPFVGKSGIFLRKCLNGIGLNDSNCYITNVIKCRPPGNRVPEYKELISCLPHLINEIKTVNPKFILLLGNTANKTLLETDSSIHRLRLENRIIKDYNISSTYHPSYILRNKDFLQSFIDDLVKFINLYIDYNPLHQINSNILNDLMSG